MFLKQHPLMKHGEKNQRGVSKANLQDVEESRQKSGKQIQLAHMSAVAAAAILARLFPLSL